MRFSAAIMAAVLDASVDDRKFLADLASSLSHEEHTETKWPLWDRPDVVFTREGDQVVIYTVVNFGVPCMTVWYATSQKMAGEAAVREMQCGDIRTLVIDHPVLLPSGYHQQVLGGCYKESEVETEYDTEVDAVELIAVLAGKGQFPIRLRLGFAKGHPAERARGPITWINIDAAVDFDEDEEWSGFELSFAAPLVFMIDSARGTDQLMYMEWKDIQLVGGQARWNKLSEYGDIERYQLDSAYEDWSFHEQVLWFFKWDTMDTYYDGFHVNEWKVVRDALAYIFLRQSVAARKIQRSWRRCSCDTQFKIARDRVSKMFGELEDVGS